MGNFLDLAVKETGRGFDIERKLLMPPNSWVAFLARDGRDQTFSQLRYFDKSFITRSNNFRSGFYVEIATTDDLQPIILKSSHFSVNGQCYAIDDGDSFPPSGDRLSWMVYGAFVKDVYAPV